MVDCAQYEHFAFFSPSYPQYFAAYLNYTTVGSESPAQLLPAAFSAASAANMAGTFTSTGMAFSTMLVGPDKTPPVTPAAPTTTSISPTGTTITWIPTTDNVGVAGYNIYRNGSVASQLAVPPFHDTGLTPGLTYIYTLSAFDAQGNTSSQSAPLSVTTINTTPPTVPTNLTVTGVTANSVSLSWSASTDPGGVGGYRVLKGSSPNNMTIIDGSVTGTTYTGSHLASNTTYYYAVEAYNSIGISSAPCAPVSAKTDK
jgi:chitodextrinase